MASQILSGAKNVSYTNDTGQNVRLVINHLSDVSQITWAGNTKVITNPNSLSISYGQSFGGIATIPLTGAGRPYAKTRPRGPGSSVTGIGVFNTGGYGSKFYLEDGFGYFSFTTGSVTYQYYDHPVIPFTAGPVINSNVKTFGGIMQEGDYAGGVGDQSPPVFLFDGGTESVTRASGPGGENVGYSYGGDIRISIPRTIFLSPGQSFSAICRAYNIVVIKEGGN